MVVKGLKVKSSLIGFLMLPVILCYKLALAPLGKQCHYIWGDCDISLTQSLSENEYLWMRVSPIMMVNLLLILAIFFGNALIYLNHLSSSIKA